MTKTSETTQHSDQLAHQGAGSMAKTQFDADQLPEITEDYAFKDLNAGVVHVNTHLADGYNELGS